MEGYRPDRKSLADCSRQVAGLFLPTFLCRLSYFLHETVNSYIPIVIEIPAVVECFLKYKTKPETLVEWRKAEKAGT